MDVDKGAMNLSTSGNEHKKRKKTVVLVEPLSATSTSKKSTTSSKMNSIPLSRPFKEDRSMAELFDKLLKAESKKLRGHHSAKNLDCLSPNSGGE